VLNDKTPLISIIILNYNSGELILRCIESVINANYNNIEVIVVDNISTDNSHKECKKQFPEIRLIENKENLGYCEGNNVGIRECLGEFIVILNPDTMVDEFWLDNLLKAYRENGDGLYQPKLLFLDNKKMIQSRGNFIQLFGFGFSRDRGKDDFEEHDVQKIGYASGTSLFTSKKIIDRIGMLDPFLFLYHDDLELGWRAANQGIFSYYVPDARVFHVGSYSLQWNKKKFYWLERNRKYCILTHFSKKTYSKLFYSLVLVDILVWGFYFSKGMLLSKMKADYDIFKNRKLIKEKFLEIESKKTISDSDIINSFTNDIFIPEDAFGKDNNTFFHSILSKLSIRVKKRVRETSN
tara:strand:- start:3289 stop:4344 length:1056 start_codon:yes stop_codon:yes gene_type:complete